MRPFPLLLIGAALLPAALIPTATQAAPRLRGEARVAEAVEGRVAGDPVDCINLRNVRSTEIVDRTAILYDTGRTIYVNRPRAGRESLDRFDALVTRNYDSRLCSVDTVRLYDTTSRFESGFVFLDEFVPYRRVR